MTSPSAFINCPGIDRERLLIAVFAALSLIGCTVEMGGDRPPPDGSGGITGGGSGGAAVPPKSLVGTWLNQASVNSATGFAFNDAGTYGRLFEVVVDPFNINAQTEKGSYQVSASEIFFTATEATCPGPVPRYKLGFAWSGDLLVLEYSDAIVSYERLPDGGGSTVTVRLGCFDQVTGAFSPMASAPVTN